MSSSKPYWRVTISTARRPPDELHRRHAEPSRFSTCRSVQPAGLAVGGAGARLRTEHVPATLLGWRARRIARGRRVRQVARSGGAEVHGASRGGRGGRGRPRTRRRTRSDRGRRAPPRTLNRRVIRSRGGKDLACRRHHRANLGGAMTATGDPRSVRMPGPSGGVSDRPSRLTRPRRAPCREPAVAPSPRDGRSCASGD